MPQPASYIMHTHPHLILCNTIIHTHISTNKQQLSARKYILCASIFNIKHLIYLMRQTMKTRTPQFLTPCTLDIVLSMVCGHPSFKINPLHAADIPHLRLTPYMLHFLKKNCYLHKLSIIRLAMAWWKTVVSAVR